MVVEALEGDLGGNVVKGVFFARRAVVPRMKQSGAGSIVNIGSVSAVRPVGSSVPYMASKAAVHPMTQSLAVALDPQIRVNCVAPGFIETRWHAEGDEATRVTRERTPLKRNGTPEDVAQAVLYLCTAPFVTGEIVVVDGGRFLQ